MRFREPDASVPADHQINVNIANGFVDAMQDPQKTWRLWQSSLNEGGGLDHNPEQLIPEAMKLMTDAEKAQNNGNSSESGKLKLQASAKLKTAIDDMIKATKLNIPPEVLQKAAKQSAQWWQQQTNQVTETKELATAKATSQMLSTIADMYQSAEKSRLRGLNRNSALMEIKKKRARVQQMLKEAEEMRRSLLHMAQIQTKHYNIFDSPQDKAISTVKSAIESYNTDRQKYTSGQPKTNATKPEVSAIEDIDNSKTIPEAEKKILQHIS